MSAGQSPSNFPGPSLVRLAGNETLVGNVAIRRGEEVRVVFLGSRGDAGRVQVPQEYGAVSACGSEECAVGVEGRSGDQVCVTGEDAATRTGCRWSVTSHSRAV
jgi:hypothetical protein